LSYHGILIIPLFHFILVLFQKVWQRSTKNIHNWKKWLALLLSFKHFDVHFIHSWCLLITTPSHLKKCIIKITDKRYRNNSRSKLKTCEQLDVFLITYLHWWCNAISNNNYSNEQSNISYSLFMHSISSLEEKVWIQLFKRNFYFNSSQYYRTVADSITSPVQICYQKYVKLFTSF
jgi:hypothetical protein